MLFSVALGLSLWWCALFLSSPPLSCGVRAVPQQPPTSPCGWCALFLSSPPHVVPRRLIQFPCCFVLGLGAGIALKGRNTPPFYPLSLSGFACLPRFLVGGGTSGGQLFRRMVPAGSLPCPRPQAILGDPFHPNSAASPDDSNPSQNRTEPQTLNPKPLYP